MAEKFSLADTVKKVAKSFRENNFVSLGVLGVVMALWMASPVLLGVAGFFAAKALGASALGAVAGAYAGAAGAMFAREKVHIVMGAKRLTNREAAVQAVKWPVTLVWKNLGLKKLFNNKAKMSAPHEKAAPAASAEPTQKI